MSKGIESGARIRMAVPDDASSIASILHRSFVEYEFSYTAEAFAATISTPAQIRERFAEGPIWVALQGEIIVGTVSAVPQDEALYIRSMAVDPAVRAKGTGRELLKYAEEFAIKNRFKRLLLSTTPFLSRAIRLYEQCGFSESDEGAKDLFGTPLLTMAKALE